MKVMEGVLSGASDSPVNHSIQVSDTAFQWEGRGKWINPTREHKTKMPKPLENKAYKDRVKDLCFCSAHTEHERNALQPFAHPRAAEQGPA